MSDQYKNTIVITNRDLAAKAWCEKMSQSTGASHSLNCLKEQVRKIVKLKPYALILREKDLPDEAYLPLAKEIQQICKSENVKFFINGRINIAEKISCKNIHLSLSVIREQLLTKEVLRSRFQEISVPCHSMEDINEALNAGATQIVLGTIFETDCKKGLKGKGLSFVEEACKNCPVPVYAIGGITLDNLQDVIKAGANGGCMMSGFMNQKFC